MPDETRITSEQPLSRYGVRLSLRSSLALVFAFAVTVLVLEIVLDAQRVIAWALTAMAIAALLQPAVEYFSRFMARGLAVLVVVVLILGSLGFVVYRVVDDISSQTRRLQRAAPERAAELEADSDLLQEIHFSDRVERLVKAIPERLRGGSTADAIRSAANRGVALLAGLILTLFFVLYGPALITGAFAQITDPVRRGRIERVSRAAATRGLGYARVQLLLLAVEGVLAFVIARAADVPGPAALAVWVALWSLIPIAGVFIGGIPVIAFAAASSQNTAILVALAFIAMMIGELFVNRELERRTLRVGPFLTALALFTGLELYGFMGALLMVLGTILLVAVVREVGDIEDAAGIEAAPA
jgi:predicted PurR-regulated permease PerM